MAAVLARTGQTALAATVTLPFVRVPVALAMSLAAIDLFSGGRLVVGVGPGSSAPEITPRVASPSGSAGSV